MAASELLDLQRRSVNNNTGFTWKFGDGTNYVQIDGNGDMSFVGGATVLTAVQFDSSVGIGGAIEVGYELKVTGDAKITDTLTVGGAAEIAGIVGVGGASVAGWELTVTGDSKVTGITALSNALERTISGGAITATRSFHTIDTEGDTASDDLDDINGGVEGMILVLCAEDSARTVVVKDSTGNLRLAGDCTLDNVSDSITLIYTASAVWRELSRSDNAA